MRSVIATAASLSLFSLVNAYALVDSYDASNWFSSFNFMSDDDPTGGFVDYVSLADAQSLGLARTVGDQVYLGVDNSTVISTSGPGRKSLWLTSKKPFLHGLLIGDFAHMPGSICGLWPAFWTIREDQGIYGEIDILEGYNNGDNNFMTMHVDPEHEVQPAGTCTFSPPADQELGTSNEGNVDCGSDVGCSVIGNSGGYGTSFNNGGGGVYAMEWTSEKINIYFFPRNAIPADITAGNPDPSKWGLPTANFEAKYGNCNIDASFLRQTIYFDTDFCGASGGQAWNEWSTCASDTQQATCEGYVAANPQAYDEAYWLVNSVKVYQ